LGGDWDEVRVKEGENGRGSCGKKGNEGLLLVEREKKKRTTTGGWLWQRRHEQDPRG